MCIRDSFYPTPSTISTCMYYTGLDPRTMEEVYVPVNPHEKAMQRALIQYRNPVSYTHLRAIGLAHSGWRGTVNRMGQAVLSAMEKEYGTDPADVTACIGPSICQDCYEAVSYTHLFFMNRFAGKDGKK